MSRNPRREQVALSRPRVTNYTTAGLPSLVYSIWKLITPYFYFVLIRLLCKFNNQSIGYA